MKENKLPEYKVTFYEKSNKYIITQPGIGEVGSFSVNRYGKYTETLVKHFCKTGEHLKNYYEYNKDYAIIHIYRKKDKLYYEAKIDLSDVEKCKQYSWSAVDGGNSQSLYVQATDENGAALKLHKFIMNEPKGSKNKVDHINGDGFDNRKNNLRILTSRGNSLNRPNKNSNNTSGYTGVHRRKDRNGWQAEWYESVNNKHTKLFKDSEYDNDSNKSFEAAKQYRILMENIYHKKDINKNTIR